MKYTGRFPTLPVVEGKTLWFKKGDKGPEIVCLQNLLNFTNKGTIVKELKPDGEFGPLTEEYVSFFQFVQGITVDKEFGINSLKKAKAFDQTGATKAVNWAVSISQDNSFSYGAGQRAHRSGCYFCQTNTGPRKKKKEKKGEPHYVKDSKGKKHTYEKTYCCNTFITAAYAHGANDAKIHAICRAGTCCGMSPSDWKKSPNFKTLGACKNVSYSKLKPGDVILQKEEPSGHVWMVVGSGRYIDATSLGGKDKSWSAKSIAVRSGCKAKYEESQKYNGNYVMRYTK